MLETQSQISFDDDNDLFRQDTDAESDGEEQQELDDDDAQDEELVDLLPAELKEEEEEKRRKKKKGSELDGTATPTLLLPKGKETILIVQPAKSPPTLDQSVAEKKKPLTLIELPVDVLKEIVKEVGLRHPPSAPPQLRVRQLLFYLPRLFLCGGWGSSLLVWPRGVNFAADKRTRVGEPHERPHQPITHVPLSPRPRYPPHLLSLRHRLA